MTGLGQVAVSSTPGLLLYIAGGLAVMVLAILLIAFVVAPAFGLVGRFVRHVFRFLSAEIGDLLRVVGAVITGLVFVPIALVNVLIGRWSAAAHYGRAIEGESKAFIGSLFRLVIGNPARLLGLSPLTEGLEQRVPAALEAAPSADAPPARTGLFEGWEIVGSLPGGGSGGKLYIAKPTIQKLGALTRQGMTGVDRVVIKSFSLRDGSTLPQIVRESRALPAAKRLGLILEHELSNERFYYITRYVPGDSLSLVTQRMHASGPPGGLDDKGLREAISYGADLLKTLTLYHAGGLWHKDVKPDNVIVSAGRAHLVDFGLITPLRSSLTLTTHGTEYFRDPEMVRMALRGAKVHEVDGAKFDIYAVGAVLYAVLENSFPAHGGLSQISKRCPESVRWVVRRAMTDYDKRYETAGAMLADLESILASADPFALRPADLPSVRAGLGAAEAAAITVDSASPTRSSPPPPAHEWEGHGPSLSPGSASSSAAPAALGVPSPAAGSPVPPGFGANQGPTAGPGFGAAGPQGHPAANGKPVIDVTNWWSGRYRIRGIEPGVANPDAGVSPFVRPVTAAGSPRPAGSIPGSTAAEQLVRARARMNARRERIQKHIDGRRGSFEPAGVNRGLLIAGVVALLGLIFIAIPAAGGLFLLFSPRGSAPQARAVATDDLDRSPTGDTPDRAWIVGAPDADLSAWRREARADRPADDQRILLVLRDPASYEQPARDQTQRRLEALAGAGFQLRGEVEHNGGTGTDPTSSGGTVVEAGDTHDPSETEVVAELRATIGLEGLGTPAARQNIVEWLNDRTGVGAPLAVVWIGRSADGQTAAWVVAGKAARGPTLRLLSDSLVAKGPSQPDGRAGSTRR
ncbi:MAG TPA: hypothetical protein PL072_00325 [Phycisphaerales bacterium]|nr:hypothetical protein [Phycisphaerales bacterium]